MESSANVTVIAVPRYLWDAVQVVVTAVPQFGAILGAASIVLVAIQQVGVAQGMALLVPLMLFSVLSVWKRHPVILLLTAGMALMSGLCIPDLLTGNISSELSLSLGLMLVIYAFACVALAYITMFQTLRVKRVEGEIANGSED